MLVCVRITQCEAHALSPTVILIELIWFGGARDFGFCNPSQLVGMGSQGWEPPAWTPCLLDDLFKASLRSMVAPLRAKWKASFHSFGARDHVPNTSFYAQALDTGNGAAPKDDNAWVLKKPKLNRSLVHSMGHKQPSTFSMGLKNRKPTAFRQVLEPHWSQSPL